MDFFVVVVVFLPETRLAGQTQDEMLTGAKLPPPRLSPLPHVQNFNDAL